MSANLYDGSEGPSETKPLTPDAKATALIAIAWAGCLGYAIAALTGAAWVFDVTLVAVVGAWAVVATWPEKRA